MEILVYIHSYLRWVVLALGLIVIAKAVMGLNGDRAFDKSDNSMGAAFLGSVHLQLILGLILYFAGDKGLALIQNADGGMGEVMKNALLRFWAVEHVTTMIIAAIVVTVGRSRSKKAATDKGKHQQAAIFFGIAMLLILIRVPWNQVPLFKGIG